MSLTGIFILIKLFSIGSQVYNVSWWWILLFIFLDDFK